MAVIGCGGLGGYLVELLGRLGVGRIRVVDADVFDESNLNRQLLSSQLNLGKPKALAAVQRMSVVNAKVVVEGIQERLTEENSQELLQGCDLVLDALDTIQSRLLLQKAANQANLPLIHGAVAGWTGQVCVIQPGDELLSQLYPDPEEEQGEESITGNLSFTAGVIASIQAAEATKILLGKTGLRTEVLLVDLLQGTYDRIQLSSPAKHLG